MIGKAKILENTLYSNEINEISDIDFRKEFSDSDNRIEISHKKEKIQCFYLNQKSKILLVEIDFQTKITTIFPIYIIENSEFFFKHKYGDISFKFEGYNITIEKEEYEGKEEYFIYGLPEIFTKLLKYGLGFKREYKIIIDALLENLSECEIITFSKTKQTNIANNNLIINDDDLDKIRRGIDRNSDLYRKEARQAKEIFIYDSLLHSTDPQKYPKVKRKPQKDVIYKILKNTDFGYLT